MASVEEGASRDVKRGQRGVLIIAGFLTLLSLSDLGFLLFSAGAARMAPLVYFWVVLRSVFTWLLLRGSNRVRLYLGFSFIVLGSLSLLGTLMARGLGNVIISLAAGAPFLAAGLWIWRSRSLEAYCLEQDRKRNPTLSILGN